MSLAQAARNVSPTEALGSRRVIPFDHSFRFELKGDEDRDRVISRTLTVSIEAAFTAVSIGYGVIPAVETRTFGLEDLHDLELSSFSVAPLGLPPVLRTVFNERVKLRKAERSFVLPLVTRGAGAPLASLSPEQRTVLVPRPREIKFGDIIRALGRTLGENGFLDRGDIGPRTAEALSNGIRLNPEVAKFLFVARADQRLAPDQMASMFQTVDSPPGRVQFLYSLIDQGTGRELQSAPILSVAGLGSPEGERPFRSFAQPITFASRTVIRLDVTPKSDFRGELHFSLHGYKVLGGAGTPTGRVNELARKRLRGGAGA
jgi:hypothetical protein